jgi:hypothetical protein
VLDQYLESREWLLGFKLSEEWYKELQRLVLADWEKWDRAGEEVVLKEVEAWNQIARLSASTRSARRVKVLPAYLDGLNKSTAPPSDQLLLRAYRDGYKQACDQRPVARMEKQPPAYPAVDTGDFSLPTDPKHDHTFDRPTVFTNIQAFYRFSPWETYFDRSGNAHHSQQYWVFLPTGRAYYRSVLCFGSRPYRDSYQSDTFFKKYYLDSETVFEFWGRYHVDDQDRIHVELDTCRTDGVTREASGKEKEMIIHLIDGRRVAIDNGTRFDGVGKK